MTMAEALSVTPVSRYVHTYIGLSVRHSQQHLVSKSNSFDQNFMKLGHIVKYHDVFIRLDNGPYCTMSYDLLFI